MLKRIWEAFWNEDLEGKFRSPLRIGVRLRVLLKVIFLSSPLRNRIKALIGVLLEMLLVPTQLSK
jgi:hypothetical protein